MENQNSDFTTGSIPVKLIKFMAPIFGALVLQAMYGAVDLLVVGWFGTTEGISAVSTGSNLINLVVFTISGLTMGITVLISRYLGGEKGRAYRKSFGRRDLFLSGFIGHFDGAAAGFFQKACCSDAGSRRGGGTDFPLCENLRRGNCICHRL